jgi:glycosyltransferase involved in cell wall biosynthesis
MKQVGKVDTCEHTGEKHRDHPVVSVIIPAFNCVSTLGDQLDALRQQSCDTPWEVIVVDNGSTDGTPYVVERYRTLMRNLRLVSAPEKKNISYARNVGAANAQGEVFLFCDGDDRVGPGWLRAMTHALMRHQFVVGLVEVATLNSDVPDKYGNNGFNPAETLLNFLPFAIGCNFGVSRRAFESVGGFSTMSSRCMDVELSWRLQLAGYTLHEVADAEVYYRYRDSAWEHWKSAFQFSQAHVALYRNYAAVGAKRSPIKQVFVRYRSIMYGLPRLAMMTRRQRIAWAYELGVALGRLCGSLRYGTFYP